MSKERLIMGLRERVDGWINVVAGLGGKLDKRTYHEAGAVSLITDTDLASIFAGDGLGNKIISVVPDDMTREWLSVEESERETNDTTPSLNDRLASLSAQTAFNLALKWARLYGGALIVLGVMDGHALNEPVVWKTASGIEWLKVISGADVDIANSTVITDSKSPRYGAIETYKVTFSSLLSDGTSTDVHYSRCIPLFGEPVPRLAAAASKNIQYFGVSMIQPFWDDIADTDTILDTVVNILLEYVVNVTKIKGLADLMGTPEGEARVKARMEIMSLTKSVINTVMLDDTEEFSRLVASVAGVSDVIDKFFSKLSGVTGIPQTRLFGRSPAGLNATGESDMTTYYDNVRSQQQTKLKPAVQMLVDMMIRVYLKKEPKDWPTKIRFNPLVQMSEKDRVEITTKQADAELKRAQTYQAYIDMGVMTAEDVIEELENETGLSEEEVEE